MEKFVYLNELFDLYGDLLTEKQQTYFKDYYFLRNIIYKPLSESIGFFIILFISYEEK
mgnify:CR=1 FL=1